MNGDTGRRNRDRYVNIYRNKDINEHRYRDRETQQHATQGEVNEWRHKKEK